MKALIVDNLARRTARGLGWGGRRWGGAEPVGAGVASLLGGILATVAIARRAFSASDAVGRSSRRHLA